MQDNSLLKVSLLFQQKDFFIEPTMDELTKVIKSVKEQFIIHGKMLLISNSKTISFINDIQWQKDFDQYKIGEFTIPDLNEQISIGTSEKMDIQDGIYISLPMRPNIEIPFRHYRYHTQITPGAGGSPPSLPPIHAFAKYTTGDEKNK